MAKVIVCPGCKVQLTSDNHHLEKDFQASTACRELYYQLSYYTLALQDRYFTHQLIVDTYTAEHYKETMKLKKIMFALIGLYLVNEKGFTGKQVQEMHQVLANQEQDWPEFVNPQNHAIITVHDILAYPDQEKPEMIRRWSSEVWEIWKSENENLVSAFAMIS